MSRDRDILNRLLPLTLFYCLPILALILSVNLGTAPLAIGITWFAALMIMGFACLWNAWKCGRIHCFFTGPFLLILGVISLLYGLDILPLGDNGWSLLSVILLAGGFGLHFLTEMIWGRYRPRPKEDDAQ